MAKYPMSKRNIRPSIGFTLAEHRIIEQAAAADHIPLAVWARQILVESATKIEAARDEVAQASRWSSYIKSKKLLNEKELQQ